jgi:hypothetical protein
VSLNLYLSEPPLSALSRGGNPPLCPISDALSTVPLKAAQLNRGKHRSYYVIDRFAKNLSRNMTFVGIPFNLGVFPVPNPGFSRFRLSPARWLVLGSPSPTYRPNSRLRKGRFRPSKRPFYVGAPCP